MLGRIAPFFSLVSAALIFVSWTLSNTLSQQEQAARSQVTNVLESVRAYRLSRDQSSRLELLASDVRALLPLSADQRAASVRSSYDKRWPSIRFELRRSIELMISVHSLARLVEAPPTVTFDLAEADEHVSEVQKSAEQAQETITELVYAAADPLHPKEEESRKLTRTVVEVNTKLLNGLDEVIDRYELAADDLNSPAHDLIRSLERRARIAQLLSVFTFIAGTMLALYGKTVEIRRRPTP